MFSLFVDMSIREVSNGVVSKGEVFVDKSGCVLVDRSAMMINSCI